MELVPFDLIISSNFNLFKLLLISYDKMIPLKFYQKYSKIPNAAQISHSGNNKYCPLLLLVFEEIYYCSICIYVEAGGVR